MNNKNIWKWHVIVCYSFVFAIEMDGRNGGWNSQNSPEIIKAHKYKWFDIFWPPFEWNIHFCNFSSLFGAFNSTTSNVSTMICLNVSTMRMEKNTPTTISRVSHSQLNIMWWPGIEIWTSVHTMHRHIVIIRKTFIKQSTKIIPNDVIRLDSSWIHHVSSRWWFSSRSTKQQIFIFRGQGFGKQKGEEEETMWLSPHHLWTWKHEHELLL